jgi:hypothetical protein
MMHPNAIAEAPGADGRVERLGNDGDVDGAKMELSTAPRASLGFRARNENSVGMGIEVRSSCLVSVVVVVTI